ncbi:ADP-glyceromanno-heptose 6-epimerase [Campylobacter fetus]|uniref:ADP-glyceromanno-heptose 6-epimerase n=3 Tax=Campylobacter fetus TaxID=196 RepID=A0A5L4K905_CAMFE|nr:MULTISPECIES: ADP-glyceromanno-heptose 6-epimerase [Campylobacter]OCS22628.1 ADP-L-glycero-D-mannoheptose-6-epimerase [Campylobacter fetus subsp. venerealis cfvi97/532]OCS30078.1 ADP-L-glycero-D-mannoheptose-6-epimerase [Campylobacter fetus subsp. venerealis LMG 6570 = CCUG 33900]OCS43302.1 ADP-L-glycero-D-mannoheptose-6-epimerase [Campylobacter fetus subsp. venerealis cfvi02/298]ABK82171.1 ADP-L-glycero-D-manno-heptose-6-epimerase [Campylobacter fetus subsp. fetus 82-40]AHE94741.1 ADP-L-gl
MKIVVTGGAGFIGSNLAKYFMNDNEVLVVDKFRSNEVFSNGNLKSFGHFKNLIGFKGEIYCGDICSKDTLKQIESFNPDVIFHEAAVSDTTVSEQDEIIKINLNSFKDLLEIAKNCSSKMIYASSGATYGNAPSPQTVGRFENPGNVYGFSKLMMDELAKEFYAKFKTHIVGLRYFNVYGGGEFFKNKTASMVLQFGLQILSGKTPKLFEGSDKILRDFVYIKDVINANKLAINGISGIYNVGTANPRSFQDIADILQREIGVNLGNEYIKNPYTAQYQFHTQANIATTKNGLKYEPKWSLEDGIKDYLPEIRRIFKEELNG